MRLLCALFAFCGGPLASEPLPGGGRLTLHSVRDAAGPCLVIRGLPGGPRACARAPSERVPAVHRPVSRGPIVRLSRHSPAELYGETGPGVDRVIVRYGVPGRSGQTVRAMLLRARDPLRLAFARIRRPFGVYYARIPGQARRAHAVALDSRGRRLGSADFSKLLRSRGPFVALLQHGQP
jgi:hypothetical protein